MNWSNKETDRVKPISSFDKTKDDELEETFTWINTQPLLKQVRRCKGTNFDFLTYRLHFVRVSQFLKLKDDEE